MSSDPAKQTDRPKIIDRLGEELMRSATSQRGTLMERLGAFSRRRLAVPLGIIAAIPLGAAGIAVAAGTFSEEPPGGSNPDYQPVVDDGGPPLQAVAPGDTVSYVDLDSGQAIACPDGQPLTGSYSEVRTLTAPRCADGSVPTTYSEQEDAWRSWLRKQVATTTPEPPENGPNFWIVER